MPDEVSIRVARAADDAELVRIELATSTIETTPAPPPDPDQPFFHASKPADTLVAEVDGVVAGFANLGPFYAIPSSRHVLEIRGFAVGPQWHRRGVGRALLDATVTETRSRGARRLTLRVLSTNAPARRLYEAAGFEIVGVLPEQFYLGGRYVDDVLMALVL